MHHVEKLSSFILTLSGRRKSQWLQLLRFTITLVVTTQQMLLANTQVLQLLRPSVVTLLHGIVATLAWPHKEDKNFASCS